MTSREPAAILPRDDRMDLSRLDLPLAPCLPEISRLLEAHRLLVLQADPGAGKSTLVPPFLLGQSWLAGARIAMLQPRRVAAAAVAARIAELLGEPLGKRAGYRVRGSSRVSRETRIEVLTEALLTRAIQTDPLLEGVGLVIFDEFHERSIHADLALALSLEVRRARPDLALLLMSATLEQERLRAFLGAATGSDVPVLSMPGRAHPVQTRYRPPPARGRWEDAFAALVAELTGETDGTLLAFLPGMREIRYIADRLAELLPSSAGVSVHPLHGSLPLEEQRRLIAPPAASGARAKRVILATSVAETSLTVPGVRVVADSGWARTSRLHHPSGMNRLVTERVSVSSAEQRRGRAGRLGPGVCVRLWRESEGLPATPEPEILRSDLSGLVLECCVWGARRPGELAWPDPPPRAAWEQALELLRSLGFVDAAGAPTAAGSEAAGLGLHPRLAALVREGRTRGSPWLGAVMAAILEERGAPGLGNEVDFRLGLAAARARGSGPWLKAVEREAARIARLLGVRRAPWGEEDEESAGDLLVRAFPDRVARREPDGSWRFVSGRIARFPLGPGLAPLAGRQTSGEEWLTAPEVDAGETIGTIRLAAPVSRDAALEALEPVSGEKTEIRWEGLRPRGARLRLAGRLLVAERPLRPDPQDIAGAFLARLQSEGAGILPWDERSRRLLDRLRFHAGQGGELRASREDALSERLLAQTMAELLDGWLVLTGGPVLTAERLLQALRSLPQSKAALEREAPESLVLPTGLRRRIDYSGATPAVEARIQEVFGLRASPRVAGVPLTFRLLSPAGRPLQITRDLASFWRSTYPEVRKEMRGRYPRHVWPENPLEARPTTRAKPRKG